MTRFRVALTEAGCEPLIYLDDAHRPYPSIAPALTEAQARDLRDELSGVLFTIRQRRDDA